MGTTPIMMRPGVDVVKTPLLNEGAYSDSDKIRFFNNQAQKLGGWSQLSADTYGGVCRGLHAWVDLNGIGYIAIGTDTELDIWSTAQSGTINDITPLRASNSVTGPYTTITGSANIEVTDPSAPTLSIGDPIYVATASDAGGLLIQGAYTVNGVIDGTHYTFSAGTPALHTVSGVTNNTFSLIGLHNGSTQVTVSLATVTLSTGETIFIYVPFAAGGQTLQGNYILTSAVHFNASGSFNASFGGFENNGNVLILYPIAPSSSPSDPYSYSNGPYGAGAFGYGQGVVTQFTLRQWSLDNWGQILLASPSRGPLYDWTPPWTYNNRAALVANAPAFNQVIFVAMPQRQVVSLGSDGGAFLDPLLVRWCDVNDYSSTNSWVATVTNQAGSYRIPRGSKIIGGFQGAIQGYIWTDIEFWTMQYTQPPFIYSFVNVGKGCGLIAQRAAAEIGGKVLWASYKSIFQFDGQTVSPVPCPVWDYFYNNVDLSYADSITAAPNSDFTEWGLFFPTSGSQGINTSYIKVNVVTGVWDKGTMDRTAWTDRTDVASPVGAENATKKIMAHEVSNDANGVAMDSYAETAWFKLAEGMLYIDLDRIIPDFTLSGTVKVTVYVTNYPNETPRTYGPYTVDSTTQYLVIRARGRLAKIRIESDTVGAFWRQGQFLSQGAPSGRR